MNSELLVPTAPPTGETAVARKDHDAANALLRTMDRAGWMLDWVDMDLTGSAPKVEIRAKRYDGLWLRADLDCLGRATVERFRREHNLGMRDNEKGCRPLAPVLVDHFMGRQRYEGGRAMMRGLCVYLTDNALHPVALADMRAAWAALMQSPARIDGPRLGQVQNS